MKTNKYVICENQTYSKIYEEFSPILHNNAFVFGHADCYNTKAVPKGRRGRGGGESTLKTI